MAYNLKIPLTGFSKVYLHRPAWSESVEVMIPELDATYEVDQAGLLLWLQNAFGLYGRPGDRLVDMVWNWRVIEYDVPTNYIRIPRSQARPGSKSTLVSAGTGSDTVKWNLFEPLTGSLGRDRFDPLA